MDGPGRRLDVDMQHSTHLDAATDDVWEALTEVDPGESPVIRLLLALRGLPRRGPLTLEALADAGFRPMRRRPPTSEDPTGEVTLGLIARPWTVRGGVHRGPGTDLAGFDEPGYAVITWSYVLSPEGKGTVVTTRTTVRCTDEPSRRRFLRYWRIVRPFSGVIRRESLRLLRRRVEQQAATG